VFVDGEHSAQVPMMATEQRLESPTEEIHKFHTHIALHAPVEGPTSEKERILPCHQS
jgi:hypothetical protein